MLAIVSEQHLAPVLTLAIGAFVLVADTGGAEACSLVAPRVFEENDGAAVDVVDASVSLTLEGVGRGIDLPRGDNSCDDIGHVAVRIRPADARLGYDFEITDGQAPEGGLWTQTLHVDEVEGGEAVMVFAWNDGASYEQEPVDFEMIVTPVDPAGNRGPTSAPLRVYDPGRGPYDGDDAGCSMAPGGSAGGWAPLAALLIGVACHRRRRAPSR